MLWRCRQVESHVRRDCGPPSSLKGTGHIGSQTLSPGNVVGCASLLLRRDKPLPFEVDDMLDGFVAPDPQPGAEVRERAGTAFQH